MFVKISTLVPLYLCGRLLSWRNSRPPMMGISRSSRISSGLNPELSEVPSIERLIPSWPSFSGEQTLYEVASSSTTKNVHVVHLR